MNMFCGLERLLGIRLKKRVDGNQSCFRIVGVVVELEITELTGHDEICE